MCWRNLGGGAAAAVMVLTAFGCSGKDTPVKVKGIVTLDDQPVEGATVTFLPEGGSGRNANGRTRADGSFELTTFTTNDGVLPGNYKVTVEYVEPPEISGEAKNQQEAMEAIRKGQRQSKKKPPRYVIPAVYSNPARTTLRQKVPPDGKVILDLRSRGS